MRLTRTYWAGHGSAGCRTFSLTHNSLTMVDSSPQETNTRLTNQILELLALKPGSDHPKVRQKALTTDEYYATELPQHRKYLLEFHVNLCDCEKTDCLNAHSPEERRRIPVITETWKWSYFPHKCKQGFSCTKVSCSKSHNDDEVKYHPTVYKTKPCIYPLTDSHVCSNFGLHCPFAHSEKDLRSGLRPESSDSEEEIADLRRSLRDRKIGPKISAPPFQATINMAVNLEKVHLRTSIERLKGVLTCSGCMKQEKEWLLDCGHMLCGGCRAGRLQLCPVCGEEVRNVREVQLA